jgi:ribosome-associated protein
MAVDGPLAVTDRLVIPASELSWRFSASGGPGGQHANTSNTRVEVVWDVEASAVVTDEQRELIVAAIGPRVRVAADDTRSQLRNRELVLQRLAERIRASLRRPVERKKRRPSRRAKERRLTAKRRRSQTKANRSRPGVED